MTTDKIEDFGGIELLPHSPYSSDLAPSDYYLIRSMAHFLRGRHLRISWMSKLESNHLSTPSQRNGSAKD